jgi:uncharacterized protein (TIGR03435 family)
VATTSWKGAAPWTTWRCSFRSPETAPASDTAPDERSALQDQLGMKLQSARVALDALIVDHLERPTED